MNYSEETTQYMIEVYKQKPSRETVENLAAELEKTIKSIIGKLSREGVYRREVYKTKAGDNPITKKEIVIEIAEALRINEESLPGLDKAPKNTLKLLEASIKCLASTSS